MAVGLSREHDARGSFHGTRRRCRRLADALGAGGRRSRISGAWILRAAGGGGASVGANSPYFFGAAPPLPRGGLHLAARPGSGGRSLPAPARRPIRLVQAE